MTPRILAIDLSLTATGWCRDRGDELLHGVHAFPKLRGWERLQSITDRLWEHLDPNGGQLVVLEGYSFGSKGRSVFQIAELGGVVRFGLYEEGVPFVDVPPSSLKKFATGKGNAGKDEMIAAAIRKYGFTGCNNNEADSFLLWQMARAAYADASTLPEYQREALSKVEWPEVD